MFKPPIHFRIALISAVCAAALLARTPGEPLKPGMNFFSKQQDVQLGQEAAQKVRQQYQAVPNKFLQDYIQRVGARLAATPEARDSGFPFNFTLIVDPSINAFALPGGPMFINSGLLKAVDTEGELAGVMAHEMSHVILRHGTHQASRANIISLPAALAGAVLGGSGSMLGQLASAGIGLGANSVLLKYSRDAESEADALGSHLMAEAGWDPHDMAKFFLKLEQSGGSRGPQFLSDHPNPGNREAAISAEIHTLPQRAYNYQTGEFARAKTEIGSVAPGNVTSAASAYRGNVQPPAAPTNGQFSTFNGQNFQIAYPSSWQTLGANEGSSSVTIAPRDGLLQGANGGEQVGLGAIVSYFFPERDRVELVQDTQDLIHHLEQQNRNLHAVGQQKNITVGGRQAKVTLLESDSPFGGVESDGLVTVATPDGLFYMIFIAPQNQFRNSQDTFNRMVTSIRFK